jgi:hypothetical protein
VLLFRFEEIVHAESGESESGTRAADPAWFPDARLPI